MRIELDHPIRPLIHDPDVVLRIDPQPVGEPEPVRVLADLADDVATGIELEESRPWPIDPSNPSPNPELFGTCEAEFTLALTSESFAMSKQFPSDSGER